MPPRLLKIAIMSLVTIATICAVAVGAVFWQLSRGPLSLDFMRASIEAEINKNLPDLTLKLDGVVLERDAETRMPQIRLRNLELLDRQHNTIARAPRAAISIDERALLTGAIVPRELNLIGPRIMIKRSLGGGFIMGFGRPGGGDDLPEPADSQGKSDQAEAASPIEPEINGADIIEILSNSTASLNDGEAGMSSVDFIKISDASITLFDESNNAYWNAPRSDLVFKRMPYGFAVVVNAMIQSEGDPIRTEISASYRRELKDFSISARIYNFVPSEISKKVFALSQLARVAVPLSGHAELEMTELGRITKGSAEFSVSRGQLSFPDYISQPVAIEEGSLRLDYDPLTGGVVIVDSNIVAGRSRANLTGRIDPVRDGAGILTALRIAVDARSAPIDQSGAVDDESMPVDRVDFRGLAAVNSPSLDVEDLIVMKGDSGLRLRGVLTGGDLSPGIRLAGRVRDMPAPLLKKLWPPIVAPNTRKWVNENIRAGRITDGEIVISLAEDQLARSRETKQLPDGSVKLRLALADVSTAYFKALPQITGASGSALLDSNSFSLQLDRGVIDMPSGKSLALNGGTMNVADLLKPVSPAEFRIDASASLPAVLEYLSQPDLDLLKTARFDLAGATGNVAIDLSLSIPFMKNLPRDMVKVAAKARIIDAALPNAIQGIDLTDGVLDVAVDGSAISGEGPVKLNGVAAKLSWNRTGGPNPVQSATIETELDDKERAKIGVILDDFLSGPVKVKVSIEDLNRAGRIAVEADLSKATMTIGAISWTRPPSKGTRASFFYSKSDQGAQISGLEIKGSDILLKGDVKVGKDGSFLEASLPAVNLDDENRFGITLKRTGDGMAVTIDGQSFDARPLIRSVFGPSSSGDGSSKESDVTYLVTAKVDRVYAHRGEIIGGLNGNLVARGGAVLSANLQGTFLSGQPISFRIEPTAGGREMRIGGRDGGSALRAANLYSKIAGGQIEFNAKLGQGGKSGVREGRLVIRNFEVRNEAALAELDRRGKPKQTGPRRDSIAFNRLKLPFTSDSRFIRITDAEVSGNEICATADGIIRKSDSAIDIDGTIIPACGLNNIPGKIPVVGLLFDEGLFALTYAMSGNISNPRFQYNPISAVAPGILRKFFEYGDVSPSSAKKPATGKNN